MTLYWIVNPCALNLNTIYNNWNAIGYRKALYTELFFVFFVYFITQALSALVFQNNKQKNQKERKQIQTGTQQQNKKPDLPWHQKKWNRDFAILYANHSVALGMCILFSPFAGAVTVAYLHFVVFVIYMILQFKSITLPAKIARIILDLFNLSLILIGLISINLATCSSTLAGYCKNGQQVSPEFC